MGRRKRIWLSFDSLDDKVFFLTVAVSIIVSIVVYITDILEGLSLSAQLAVLVILAFMLLLLFLGIRYPGRRKLLRFCLVLVLNFAMFPLSFFYSGGIHSGMILFFLVGLFLVPVMLHGKTSIAMFLLSLVFMIIIIDISQYRPHSVVPMSMEQHFQDVKVTMVISGIGLYAITVLILGAYDRERRKNNELMASLHDLSIKDALSGLYNRRELYRRLEIMYAQEEVAERKNTLVRENHYIAMFDIDDFKMINDTYGHDVGDDVLRKVSQCLGNGLDNRKGEIAARYGGEEFVCILYSGDMDEALRRTELCRQQVFELAWEHIPSLHVTISGGLVSCMDGEDLGKAMKEADKLLYQAKASGKNQICRKIETRRRTGMDIN
ncbi:MAG TPA: hypothetical protein DHV42_06220 [Lachnospiraceae bacterium]|nr:hypothetical protein [Lachnospiraceae bacterium]